MKHADRFFRTLWSIMCVVCAVGAVIHVLLQDASTALAMCIGGVVFWYLGEYQPSIDD